MSVGDVFKRCPLHGITYPASESCVACDPTQAATRVEPVAARLARIEAAIGEIHNQHAHLVEVLDSMAQALAATSQQIDAMSDLLEEALAEEPDAPVTDLDGEEHGLDRNPLEALDSEL